MKELGLCSLGILHRVDPFTMAAVWAARIGSRQLEYGGAVLASAQVVGVMISIVQLLVFERQHTKAGSWLRKLVDAKEST